MKNAERKILSWSDFPYMGLAFAVLLSGRDEYRDGFYQLILAGIFFVLTGYKENAKKLLEFVRRFPFFAAATVIWTIYFGIIHRTDTRSERYAITVFFLLFAGFCIARMGEEYAAKTFGKLWVALLILILCCDVNFVITGFSQGRMHLFFLNTNLEGYVIIAFLLLSIFFIKTGWQKTAGIVVSLISVLGTGSKGCTLMAAIILIGYLFAHVKEIAARIRSNKKQAGLIIGFSIAAVIITLIMIRVFAGEIVDQLALRYTEAINDIVNVTQGSQLADYSSSTNYRLFDIKAALETYPKGDLFEVAFGRGLLHQYYYALRPIASRVFSSLSDLVGPAENTFLSVLYDYGAVAFLLFAGTFMSAILCVFRRKGGMTRKMSYIMICMMLLNMTVDMEYWTNVMFIVWIFMGIYIGGLTGEEKKEVLAPSILFYAMIVVMIWFLPKLNSVMTTIMNGREVVATDGYLFVSLLSVVMVILSVFVLCYLTSIAVCRLWFAKRVVKGSLIGIGVLLCVLLLGVWMMYDQIGRVQNGIIARIDEEKGILQDIRQSTGGRIYIDTFPEVYDRADIQPDLSLFRGRELVCYDNITILTDISTDSNVFNNKGFLYLPVSEQSAIYTNDEAVIKHLREEGKTLTGYCTYKNVVDTKEEEDMQDITRMLYSGQYTAAFLLRTKTDLDGGGNDEVCVLKIAPQPAAGADDTAVTPYAEITITADQFDQTGGLRQEIPFTALTGITHFILEGDTSRVRLDGIEYQRTPDYDIQTKIDEQGRIIYERYYDLEGNPYALPEGKAASEYGYDDNWNRIYEKYYDAEGAPVLSNGKYCSVSRRYNWKNQCTHEAYYGVDGKPIEQPDGSYGYDRVFDDRGRVIECTYLGKDMKPTTNTSGYSTWRRTYTESNQVAREAYYDVKGEPVELASGQQAVEYEYDDAGNRIIDRYYKMNHEPVLYNGAYWYIKRAYDEAGKDIHIEYYGLDDSLIEQSDGSYGYDRVFDDQGRVIEYTYLGKDLQPTTNASGYSTWRRTYTESNQVAREAYYDVKGQPVELASGQQAVEYEYDDAGNRIIDRYYNMNHEPVLYNGAYWYIKRAYDEAGRDIHIEYYGLDDSLIELSDGSYGYDRVFDDQGRVIECTYLGKDLQPTTNTSGYSTWRRAYTESNQVAREEYYDVKGQPVELASGQQAVEYEYDDAGNRIIDRFYNMNHEPVLYNGAYWYIKRVYDEAGRDIHIEYYGLDDSLIELSDGSYGYDRVFDDQGRVIECTHLGKDMQPTTNTSGYSTWRRTYTESDQIAREAYYDVKGEPVELASGQQAVEYEYDDAGVVIKKIFFDIEGNVFSEEVV